eukprot:836439-Pyramimonas_sp.AAC.2
MGRDCLPCKQLGSLPLELAGGTTPRALSSPPPPSPSPHRTPVAPMLHKCHTRANGRHPCYTNVTLALAGGTTPRALSPPPPPSP